jgi:hypothetical protein
MTRPTVESVRREIDRAIALATKPPPAPKVNAIDARIDERLAYINRIASLPGSVRHVPSRETSPQMVDEAEAARKERQRQYQREYHARRKVVHLAQRRAIQDERGTQVEEFLRGVYRRAAIHNRNTLEVRP